MKEIRFNASESNSEKLRAIKREYEKKNAPAKLSLHALANSAISHGLYALRGALNLRNE